MNGASRASASAGWQINGPRLKTLRNNPRWRTLLLLGRVSNLPTVWSNCLAAWLLGGAGSIARLLWVTLGGTLLYTGGMFLNDAFDARFDRQHRRERPIPSGAIREKEVWLFGAMFLIAGLITVAWISRATTIVALLLIACILVYDAIHKIITAAPLLMGLCRFLLFLLAAAAARKGITGLAIWSGLALALYVVGLSYIAQRESLRGSIRYWPILLLAAPVCLAWLVNDHHYRLTALLLAAVLIVWVVRSLGSTYREPGRNVGHTVSGLLAGIVLVDWLAVAGADVYVSGAFILLFLLARLFQRFFPAT
jgi:4-hydroxybenzoate polyprenyltransferase